MTLNINNDWSGELDSRVRVLSPSQSANALEGEDTSLYLFTKAQAKNARMVALQLAGDNPACVINDKGAVLEFNPAFLSLITSSIIAPLDQCRTKPRLCFTREEHQQSCDALFQKVVDGEILKGSQMLVEGDIVWQIIMDELVDHKAISKKADYFSKRQFLLRFIEVAKPINIHLSTVFMQKIFGLTPAEANLCGALLVSHALPEAAQTLGIKNSTARTQLKSIFAKVEVNSQIALVAKITLLLARCDHQDNIKP